MEFICIKTNCIGHVVILSVPHAQKIMSNMPFLGKSDIQHFCRWPRLLSMYLFESFDSYISETRLYASNNAKQSHPRVIVCAGVHHENSLKLATFQTRDL